jgi:peptide/nickel transport system substrate-binding protein
MVTPSDVRSFDPATMINAGVQASTFGNALYDVLMWIEPNGKLHPGLALSLTTQDGLTWTLKLRPNLKFTDGTPVDADAVKFSMERLKDPALASPSRGAANTIATLTASDPLTLNITLVAKNFQFPWLLGFYALNWVVSPTAVRALGADFGTKPVGAGPFVVQSRVPASQTVLIRNPNYWNKPLPYLDQITLKINPDSAQGLDTVKSGGADAGYSSSFQERDQAKLSGLQSTYQLFGGGVAFHFNTTRPPFNDTRARRAVSLAFDPNVLNQSVFGGAAVAPKTIFSSDSPFYDKSLQLPVNNPKEAQRLLDELASGGTPLHFGLNCSPNTVSVGACKSLQTQLASYKNLTIDLNLLDNATFTTKLLSKDFDLTIGGTNSFDPEPNISEGYRTGGAVNFGGFSDPIIDQALTTGRSTNDLAARKAAYSQFQKEWIAQVPAILLWRFTPGWNYTKKLTGFRLYGQGNLLVDQFGFVQGK